MRAADGSLLIVALVAAWTVYRAHRNPQNTFDVFDLVMEGGRLSRLACAFMATLFVTSWVVVRLTFDGKLTEGFFIGYGGMWVAPILARLFSSPPSTATTITQNFESQTVERK